MKKYALALFDAALLGTIMLGNATMVSAQATGTAPYTTPTAGLNAITSGRTTQSLPQIISSLLNVMFGVLGIIAVLIVIWSGFQWMTGGDEGVKKAQKNMKNAAIGLLLILTAYAITSYVIGALTTATTTGI